MGIYIKKNCSDCGFTLQPWERGISLEFGEPFEICPSCKSVIDRSKDINEWFLLGVFGKIRFLGWNFICCILGGGVIAFIPLLILLVISFGFKVFDFVKWEDSILIATGAVYLIIVIRLLYVLFKDIHISANRRYDTKYMDTLKYYGFLDKKSSD